MAHVCVFGRHLVCYLRRCGFEIWLLAHCLNQIQCELWALEGQPDFFLYQWLLSLETFFGFHPSHGVGDISLAHGSSFLRYPISQSSPIGSQRHLEAALAITNLEHFTSSVKQRKTGWRRENIPNQHPSRGRDTKQGNHSRNRYCLSIVAWLPHA